MAIKINIRKIVYLSLWLAAGAGLLVLLVAAINKKNHAACSGISISIHGGSPLFLDKQDVLSMISPGRDHAWKGKPLTSFDLNRLESLLRRNAWVRKADLFFDNNGLLRVNIDERVPVARVFTVNGNSFYIDSSCTRLPLGDKMAVSLPVFTGFPAEGSALHGADSVLMLQVKQLSLYMMQDSFWLAQVQQVAITANRSFEMVPVIGNYIIVFGDGSDYEAKFHRLLLFYRQVAAQTGFGRYTAVNVAYAGQVIGVKKGPVGKVDSLQALKNIQQMIEASHRLPADTVSTTVDNNIMANGGTGPILPVLSSPPVHPSPVRSRVPVGNPVQRPFTNQSVPPGKPKPRAVMPRIVANN